MEGSNFNDVSVTALAHSNQNETTSSGGKKRKWYLSEWFERRRDTRIPKDPNSLHETSTDSPPLFTTCVSCEWQSYAKVDNATQLGHHLLWCPQVPKDVKTRLLQENTLLKHDRKRRRGHSQLFGTQITPTKPRSSSLYLSRENIQPSNTIQRNDSNYGTLDFGSDATLPVNVRVESEESYRKRTTLNELVTRFVINNMLPFSTLSRRPGKDLFFQIAKLLNPELSEQLPTAYKMSERNLSAY
ncbi:hypothetical protein BWQ96_06897 [Gracilariopsis chorda]|uniref:Uncharacterized protein n=1 Tax=Gracilariopsis chorda TaxID=448386 RepID=A0A2V3IMM3_9FLOR|nr:hypothetical protein BWQ96_06897 [Gracilariopsis chorda]|eukprot:PXF43334.1 hypothetical protein BWQ96_06897 [Gracilariopsis chorda]